MLVGQEIMPLGMGSELTLYDYTSRNGSGGLVSPLMVELGDSEWPLVVALEYMLV